MLISDSFTLFFIGLLLCLYFLTKKQVSFSKRVFLALIGGIALGALMQWLGHGHAPLIFRGTDNWFQLVGNGYLGLLKMLVIPLILTSIIQAIIRLDTSKDNLLSKLASRSIAMLLIMTAIASAIGLTVGRLFNLGQGLMLNYAVHSTQHNTDLPHTLLGMIPTNLAVAMVNQNTIALAIFAVLLGVSARWLSRTDSAIVEPFNRFIDSIFHIVKKLTQLVIYITPYGVLALMAHLSLYQGPHAFLAILGYFIAIYVAMALVVLMHLTLVTAVGMNPITFLRKVYPALLVAFTTRSSFGTLPVAEEVLRNRLKTRQITATFVPSIGASIGMNACAGVYPAMLVVMSMTILHIPLTLSLFVTVMFINMIASLGISGVPGVASIAAGISLSALGLPYAIIAVVQGVDPLVDMGRTAVNINGVLTTGYVVDKTLPHTVAEPMSVADVDNVV